jgi:hypothetical protein
MKLLDLPLEILVHIINNIGNFDTLYKLQQTNKVLYKCVNSSYFRKVKKCLKERWNEPLNFFRSVTEDRIFFIGCACGIFQILKEYSGKLDRIVILKGFEEAAKNGQLEVLKWLKDNFKITEFDLKKFNNYAFIMAIKNGHLEVSKWLIYNYNITKEEAKISNNYAFRCSAKNGQLEILKLLKYKFDITEEEAKLFKNEAFREAAYNGYIEVLTWLKENFNITAKEIFTYDFALRYNTRNGYSEVLKWLEQNFNR